ncbi:hypothetical protein [Actinoplanes sp. ATCC 53533]|uniref:hypothetical protein n=1 Tax=Actinoplanes sp. ATCC 53533 TaxID=1288362 RepID=UPI0018F515F6|nr:hypothetical protein [Actinoplanes sp. ATCC 53533]
MLDHYAARIFEEYGLADAVRWFVEMVHDAGDDSTAGPFRRRLAKARLDRLFSSPPAAAAFADLMAGTALAEQAS